MDAVGFSADATVADVVDMLWVVSCKDLKIGVAWEICQLEHFACNGLTFANDLH